MDMSKFERRRQEAQRKFDDEMRALEAAEKKEIERKIEPIIAKIAKVAEEEARKLLEENPDLLSDYSFKKREAGKELREAILRMIGESSEADGSNALESGVKDAGKDAEDQGAKSTDPFDSSFAADDEKSRNDPAS